MTNEDMALLLLAIKSKAIYGCRQCFDVSFLADQGLEKLGYTEPTETIVGEPKPEKLDGK